MRHASFGEFIIAVLLACYLIICFSPLRLEYDSIHYFSLKDCLEHSCPPGFVAAADPHPYGYPLLLLLLSRMGLLYAFTLVFLNLLFLVGALSFVVGMFKGKISGRKLEWGVILVLLSYPIVKFFSYPLSEMQYLFFSCGCLYFFQLYMDRGGRAGALVMAVLFAGLAILTRTAGVVLLAAMLAEWGWRHKELLKRRWGWVLAGLAALVAGGVFFLKRPGLYVNSVQISGKGWGVLLREHFMEWGQLLLNVPAGKVPGLPARMMTWVFVLLGVFFVGVVVYCLFRKGKQLPLTVSVYLVLYCLLIFYWPFFDVRFWIPVLPFAAALFLMMSFSSRGVVRVFTAVYILAGVGAIGYSTYLTFSKPALARTQAGGRYRNEYETFFFGKPLQDSAAKVDPYVLHVLETCK